MTQNAKTEPTMEQLQIGLRKTYQEDKARGEPLARDGYRGFIMGTIEAVEKLLAHGDTGDVNPDELQSALWEFWEGTVGLAIDQVEAEYGVKFLSTHASHLDGRVILAFSHRDDGKTYFIRVSPEELWRNRRQIESYLWTLMNRAISPRLPRILRAESSYGASGHMLALNTLLGRARYRRDKTTRSIAKKTRAHTLEVSYSLKDFDRGGRPSRPWSASLDPAAGEACCSRATGPPTPTGGTRPGRRG